MARYIDADELYKATQKRIAEANEARMAVVDDEFLDLINDAFTEDVAPRAEVAREIFEEIDKRFEALLEFYSCNGEFEDAKGFVDFHWKYIKRSIMRDYDPDFEKKYTATTDEPPKGDHHE